MLAPLGYRDVALTGKGATSRVYRAISARTGRVVALKRLYRQLLETEDALSRLRREFEALSRLRHPSIVHTYEVIRWDGDPTVVMDFVEGIGLDERIRQTEKLEAKEVIPIARALLDALSVAHGAGIVHRDVKPQNVRLGEDGRIYLLDFGSARFDASSELTATGTTVGTPDYMAPELFAGSVYDPRVDIYGVGATLYECVTGEVIQAAGSLTELAFKRTHHEVPPIHELAPDLPEALAQLIDRSLRLRPDDRFASAALARWTLDNPSSAVAFAHRRASHPPCLHCDEKIDPASATCPACGSDHPFAYESGSSHVVLNNVRDPAALSGALRARFPERRTAPHDRALAERVAALEIAPQRVVSFVDRDEACRLADELESAGASCEVIDDQGTSGWRLYGWCLVAFVVGMMVIGSSVLGADIKMHHALLLIFPTLVALLGERAVAVVRGLQGVLSESRYPAAVIEGARTRYAAAAAAFGSAGMATLVTAPEAVLAVLPQAHVPMLAASATSIVLAVAAWRLRLRAAPMTKSGSPGPSTIDMIRRAFALPKAFRDRLRPEVAVVLAASGLALIPIELVSLDAVRSMTASALISSPSVVVDIGLAEPGGISMLPSEPTVAIDVGENTPTIDTGVVTAPSDAPASARPWAASGAIFILGAFAVMRMRRRYVEVENDGQKIFRAFEHPLLSDGAAPERRAMRAATSTADRIAQSEVPDGFLLAARARAADLARCLPSESSERLERALEQVGRRMTPSSLEDAYLARSIRETDPEHRLRFELLALEGRMEADAALAWYERATRHAEDDECTR